MPSTSDLRSTRHAAVVSLQRERTRLNIENTVQLRASGFAHGTRYRVRYGPGRMEIVRDPAGDRVIAPKTFPRRDGTVRIGERLDVRSAQVAAHLQEDKVLALYLDGVIIVLRLPSSARAVARVAQLHAALERGSLRTASLYTGLGTLDLALHDGMSAAGVPTQLAFLNDHWDRAVDANLADNPASAKAQSFSGGIEELLAADLLPTLGPIDFVHLGIPCTGASRANTATRDHPEEHEAAGHQLLNAVMALQQMAWAPLILVENVVAYSTTVSCDMLRRVLHEQGYETVLLGDRSADGTYLGLDSAEFGNIESRSRMALLAYPKGLVLTLGENFTVAKSGPSAATVGAIRLPEASVPAGEYDKGRRLFREDRLARGWRPNVVADTATRTPCCTASCYKQRPEDPRFVHPADPSKTRLPLPEEHARLKGQPESLIASVEGNSLAHRMLGNGTARNCWVAVGAALARWLTTSRPLMAAVVRAAETPTRALAPSAPLSLFDDVAA